MRKCRKNCQCYFCNEKRWENLWEAYKTTDEYAEAATKERERISDIVYFGLATDGSSIRELADDRLSFDFFRKLGRWLGRKPPKQ